jgi:archaeosine-15-forming tRNA-guanine transglycosylase
MSRTIRAAVKERRRDRRITLRKPVLATVNAAPVFVLDVSSGGLRVAHRSQLPPPGVVCRLDVPAGSGTITLDCAIVHTVSQHAASAAESLFQSGLRIVSGDRDRVQKIIRGDGKEKK